LLFPPGTFAGTFGAPAFRCFGAACHLDTFPVDKCIGNFAPGFMKIPPGSFARDPEFLCRFFLFKAFQIDEPYQFDLIRLE
jgi:hypothetical protein